MLDFCAKGPWFEISWIPVWISPFFPYLILKIFRITIMIKNNNEYYVIKWHPKLPKMRNVGVACY
jgi:hypothetical protein